MFSIPSLEPSPNLALCAFLWQRSESLSKTDLKTEVVIARGQTSSRGLLVLREERKSIRNAIFERQNLIRIGRDVGRINHRHFLADLFSDSQSRSRSRSCGSADDRIDLETRQTEKLTRRSLCGRVDKSVSQQARRGA